MKKIFGIFTLILVVSILIFSVKSYAVLLDTIDVDLDKTTVRPGENVTVSINFGENLGAYTASIAYDNNIFEYVSSEGGTANDTTDKINVVYFDQTGGTSPRNNMSVTFKAKDAITSSNPTEFTVTLTGMANSDASITFDDITTPIIKNLVVEPEFFPYIINLDYTGDIIANEAKDMKLSYSSSKGKHYEKARLVAEATTPEGATVQLIGVDEQSLRHDIIQSGWGDAQGFKIGGTNFLQVLNVQGTFSKPGNYGITLKLIDRENSDSIITEKAFTIAVAEKANEVAPTEDEKTPTEPEKPVIPSTPTTTENKVENTATPTKLPKTGMNIYAPIMVLMVILLGVFIFNSRKNK